MRAWLIAVSSLVVRGACVGDDSTTKDGGADATADVGQSQESGTDASDAGPDTGPVPDGGYAFAANWPTYSTTGEGVESMGALPTGGFVLSGTYGTTNALIGSYPLQAPGDARDAWVALLDAAGKVTSAIGFGGSGADAAWSVAADSAGDVYVAGTTINGFYYGGTQLASGTFIMKIDGKNLVSAPKWTRSFELTFPCGRCLTVRNGVVALATTFGGFLPQTINYDTAKSVTGHGMLDILLLEMDASTGSVSWAGQIGGGSDDVVDGIALDGATALHIVADYASQSFTAGEALGSKSPTPVGLNRNLLVAKIDASHTPIYANAYGDPNGTQIAGNAIAADGAGHVAIAASFSGGVDFGMGPTGAASADAVFFVIDENKNQTIWQQVIGDSGGDQARGVAFDPWGNLLVTGTYQNAPQVGGTKLPSTNLLGTFIGKFGPSPTYAPEWGVGFVQLQPNASSSIVVVNVAVSPTTGKAMVGGGFGGQTDFGNGTVSAISTSGADSWVAGRLP